MKGQREWESRRLLLQPLTPGDVEPVFALVSDEEIGSPLWVGVLRTREEASRLVEGYLQSPGQFPFAIRERETGAFVGVFVLRQYDDAGLEYAATTFTGREYWGRGYAGEVLQAMLGYAREVLGARWIVDHLKLDNPASVRMHERLGFVLEQVDYYDNCPNGLGTYRLEIPAEVCHG